MNEYGAIRSVAVRSPRHAFGDEGRIRAEWRKLRFSAEPDLQQAIAEHTHLVSVLSEAGAKVFDLPAATGLTLDAIYTRDATLVSPRGLILCRMGRASRRAEPQVNAEQLEALGLAVHGFIDAPGTLEGGDFIWLDPHTAAVGLGPRTNHEGIEQLRHLLGPDVDLHVVPLPAPDHPEDVFHLMSMISPLDSDLALVYRPLMPQEFVDWLARRGIALVEVPDDEYLKMACNVLALAPRKVLMLDGLPKTRALLEDAGCKVTTYKGEHISRAGEGGPTCLTRPLIRD